jgi:hypothetical protein
LSEPEPSEPEPHCVTAPEHCSKHIFKAYIIHVVPEIKGFKHGMVFRRFFCVCMLQRHRVFQQVKIGKFSNVQQAIGNQYLKDKEFTGGMVIPMGITSSRTSKPPEEWISAENHNFMDEESTEGMEFRRESPAHGL